MGFLISQDFTGDLKKNVHVWIKEKQYKQENTH